MINGRPASEVQLLVMRNFSFHIMKDCIKKAYAADGSNNWLYNEWLSVIVIFVLIIIIT